MQYTVERSARRSYGLKVTDTAELIVKAPYHASQREIGRILAEKEAWIIKKIELAKQRLAEKPRFDFSEGAGFYYLGKVHRLVFDKTLDRKISADFPDLRLAHNLTSHARHNLELWYRYQARRIFKEMADDICARHGLRYSVLKINNPARRWGSCSSRGNINLCWRLVMMPERIIHYVIAHELAHTKHLNHSSAFWALTERLHPGSKKDDKWLNDNGHLFDWH